MKGCISSKHCAAMIDSEDTIYDCMHTGPAKRDKKDPLCIWGKAMQCLSEVKEVLKLEENTGLPRAFN